MDERNKEAIKVCEGFRMSPVQRRVWALESAGLGGPYQLRAKVWLKGAVEKEKLKQAVEAVTRRHEALRTLLHEMRGMLQPMQVVSEGREMELREVEEWDSDRDEPGKKDRGMGLEVESVNGRGGEKWLLVSGPAVAVDYYSLQLVVEEIACFYQALREGKELSLEPPLQYPDISEWLDQISDASGMSAGRKYWKQLGREMRSGQAMVTRAEFGSSQYRAQCMEVQLDPAIATRLWQGEEQGRWKAGEVVLAAWAVVLKRLKEGGEWIGVACHGRQDKRLGTVVGPLTRYLPMALEVENGLSIMQLAEQAGAAIKKAERWQDYFAWELLEREEQEEGNSVPHLKTSYDYFECGRHGCGEGVEFTVEEMEGEIDLSGLRFSARRRERELKLYLSWLPRYHRRGEVEQLGKSLGVLLGEVMRRPEVAVVEADVVEKEEAAKLLQDNHRMVRAGREGPLPLSFAQQRLWLVQQLDPATSVYNVPLAVRLEGKLNQDALVQSFTEIVRRHEVLRTTFEMQGSEVRQVIHPVQRVEIIVEDVSGPDKEERIHRLMLQEAFQPFDLQAGPLFRIKLYRFSCDEHVLQLTMHHIVTDGWSMGIIIRELGELYTVYEAQREPRLPELILQYADFAVWQRKWLQDGVLDRELGYWSEQLKDLRPLELPLDRKRPEQPSHRAGVKSFELTQELSEKLRQLSRAESVTLFMMLLAGFNIVLWRYTAQEDLAVGTAIANRNHAETEGLIGFFVNTLVLRTRLDGKLTFRELLQRARKIALEAYAHQDVPFEELVQMLQPGREAGDQQLVTVLFALQNAPDEKLTMAELKAASIDVMLNLAKFDLMVNMGESKGRIGGAFTYNADLLDFDTVCGMCETFQSILACAVSGPGRRICDFYHQYNLDEVKPAAHAALRVGA